jgi:hypothetical protein
VTSRRYRLFSLYTPALLAGAAIASADDGARLSVLLERVEHYVREFESAFALVVGEESYTQLVDVQQGAYSPPVATRKIQSELLFSWIAEDRSWLSIRNVLAVNGKRVAESERGLEDALKQPLPERDSRLHHLAEYSARFNIGSTYRNFNNPTLALQFFDATYQSRFRFAGRERESEQRFQGQLARTIEFVELQRPTIIREDGRDVPTSGSVLILESDGTVVRSVLKLAGRGTTPDVSITVDYRRDPKVETWVPARMEEVYRSVSIGGNQASTVRDQTKFNTIRAVATYSNFRRFETSGRLIPPSSRR